MSRISEATKIARLRREIERLSARHAERIARLPLSASPSVRETHQRRADLLARRIRELDEVLKSLHVAKPGRPSRHVSLAGR